MARAPNNVRNNTSSAGLDRIDRELLALLQNNARMSNKELARSVGIAPSTCLERIRRLRAHGVIRGFHADVDPALLGRPAQAIIAVRLAAHHRHEIAAFYEHVVSLPETVAVFHVTGADDYLLHVAVRDTGALRQLVLDELTARPEVQHVETRLIFEFLRKPALEPLQ